MTTSRLPSLLGYVTQCRGTTLQAQARSVAMELTVTGRVDAAEADWLILQLRRFVRLTAPVVLNVKQVQTFDRPTRSVLDDFGAQCRTAGMDWVLVADRARCGQIGRVEVPVLDSVAEAMQIFAGRIRARGSLAGRATRTDTALPDRSLPFTPSGHNTAPIGPAQLELLP